MNIPVLEIPSIRRRVAPLSLTAYHRLRDSDAVGVKTELIEGVVIEKVTKSPLHEYIAEVLQDFFSRTLHGGYMVRKEGPLTLSDSEPEPDLSIVKGTLRNYRERHPSGAELVVEIAITSLELDREKALIYARAGIPVYWLVLPDRRQVEVHRRPEDGRYRQRTVLGAADRLVTWYGADLAVRELFA
jgi:Uma2 family endonuclease